MLSLIKKTLGELYALLAGTDLLAGNFSHAGRALLIAEKLNPQGGLFYHLHSSFLYIYLKDFGKALAHSEGAIEANSSFSVAYVNRAAVELLLKNFDAALEFSNKALELNKKDKLFRQYFRSGAILNRGLALVGLGRQEEAKADVEELFNIKKEGQFGYTLLAEIHKEAGEFESAIECLSKALDKAIAAAVPDLLEERAEIFEAVGNQNAASSDRERARKIRADWFNDSWFKCLKPWRTEVSMVPQFIIVLMLVAFLSPVFCLSFILLLVIGRQLVKSLVGALLGLVVGGGLMFVCFFLPTHVAFPSDGKPIQIVTRTLDNSIFDLSEWRGKAVILYSVSPSSTHIKQDLYKLSKLYRRYPRNKLELVGIIDSARGEAFEDKNGITSASWPLLRSYDLSASTLKQLGDLGQQKFYVLSPLDQHILFRCSRASDLYFRWMISPEVSTADLSKYTGREVYELPDLPSIIIIVSLLSFMTADFILQKMLLSKEDLASLTMPKISGAS